jgi:hypothetical protein
MKLRQAMPGVRRLRRAGKPVKQQRFFPQHLKKPAPPYL